MGKVRYAVGNYAKTSYVVPQTDIAVYCIEELCYVLRENAFMLDDSICDISMVRWLEEECGLANLSRQLQQLIHQKGSASAFAGIILDYAGYGTAAQRSEIEHLLMENKDVDVLIKKKNYANYLFQQKKYINALQEYSMLIDQIPELNKDLRSEVLTNKGTTLCRLFKFQYAAELFEQAYRMNPLNERAGIQYLASQRMILTQDEYIAFIAENKEWYEYSLKLEKEYSEIQSDYAASPQMQKMKELWNTKVEESLSSYDEAIDDILERMKREYRDMSAVQER